MIEVEIYEGTNGDPLKRVYFRNTKGWIIRESFYNPSNQPIVEEMVEFDDKNKIFRQVLFLTTEYKTIAYRNLYQAGETERSDNRLGYTDYKLIDGEFKKISWMIYKPSSKEAPFSKSLYYNQDDELLYYCVNDDTTLTTKYFNPYDQVIDDFYTFSEKNLDSIETYDSIKNDLLQQIRDEYNNNQL
ncbi:hypothetical protein [Acinetobacter piscicola]|uniref:hypothetical protein n=1 Tax=Acinetobacter piscicola TaxID=2006115 RepID=UPI000B7DA311|nr:hypothetical protein [Acinetobacter piscicola]